jgi:serine/threonine-protein kinase
VLSENSTFGRYLLRRRLAAGGMGEVFVAEQTGVGDFRKSLALKLMLESLADDPRHVQLFLAEARIAARLVHPNVVQVFDAGLVEGRYFLAMELVDGVALTAINKALRTGNRRASADVICHVARQTLEALEYVHSLADEAGRPLELVHRDVSPHNLLVSSRGEVKLSDFGIAKMRDSEALTAPGEVRGKLAYLSPELILGATATARSDLYALGVTLYRLAAQTSPFSGTESELISAVRRTPEPLATHRPDLPSAIIRAIERAMAAEPGERFATAAQMREAFPRGDPEARARELGALVDAARSRPPPPSVSLGTASMASELPAAAPTVSPRGALEPERSLEPTVVDAAPTIVTPPTKRWGPATLAVASLVLVVGAVWAFTRPAPARVEPPPHVAPPPTRTEPQPPVEAAPPPPAVAEPVPQPPVEAPAVPAAKPLPPADAKKKPARTLASPAFLTVQAEPWAHVEVNGKRVGQTPLGKFPVHAAVVVLRLSNPEFRTVERRLKLTAGEELKVNEKLTPR